MDPPQLRKNVPKDLRDLRIWLCWKFELKSGKTKLDKVPYYASGIKRHGTQGSAPDCAAMVTFDEALNAVDAAQKAARVAEQEGKEPVKPFDGIGIALLDGFETVAVDLDRAKDGNGAWKPIAQRLLAIRTYAEVSPSGNGLRMLFLGEPIGNKKNHHCEDDTGFELFSTKGFVTITGDALHHGAGLSLLTPELREQFLKLANSDSAGDEKSKPAATTIDTDTFVALRSALAYITSDDREVWVRIGLALKTLGEQGRGLWMDWAQTSAKWQPGDARLWIDFRPTTIDYRAVFTEAKKRGWVNPKRAQGIGGLAADSDHYAIASAVVSLLTVDGHKPVYALGQVWVVEENLWVPKDVDQIAIFVGREFGGLKNCKRASDYKSVAWVVAQQVDDSGFFESARVGVAGPKNFWRVTDHGKIVSESLTPKHRCRVRVAAEPDFETKPAKFMMLLNDAFPKDGSPHDQDQEAQQHLVQVLFGGALTQQLWRLRVVTLFYGKTTAGKSALLEVLRSFFARDLTTACNPQLWDGEYYVAALANKVLNIVGELDPKKAIPTKFKDVVGKDLLMGRHPTHRPFSFVCTAAHFFNSNVLPPSADHTDAFFRRWRIVEFEYTVADDMIIHDLPEQIIAEESGAVLAWMLQGAAELAKSSEVPVTAAHTRLLDSWRRRFNSALQFVAEQCVLGKRERGMHALTGQELFDAYIAWASKVGHQRPFGRSGFYEALQQGGAKIDVVRKEKDGQVTFEGIKEIKY